MDNKNQIHLNYSKDSGKINNDILRDNLSLKPSLICKSCNSESKYGRYCKICGSSLEDAHFIETRQNKKYFRNNLKSIGLVSVTSILILFFIALGLKLFMSIGLGDLSRFINPLHIILAMNLSKMSITTSSIMSSDETIIHLGILLIGLIPLAILSLSNFIFIKNKNIYDVLYNSVGVGLVYGIMLVIISIISTTSISFFDMMNYGLSITFRYNIVEVLFNGFILGFISTYLMGYKKKYLGENIYLDILKKVINTILAMYISIFVILLVISILDKSYIYELGLYNYTSSTTLILSQFALYMLYFANIIPVTIGSNNLSILSLLNGDLFFYTKIIFMVMIFLSLLILIIAGYKLRKNLKSNSNKNVLIFTSFYAIIMSILSSLSTIYIGGSSSLLQTSGYQSNLFMGTTMISTFIISFIYTYIIVKIGYTLSDFE